MPINTYYETGYNTRIGVENEDQIFVRWRENSQAARDSLTCHIGVAYGNANRETIDLLPADGNSNRWLVFIHGGYWRSGDTAMNYFIATPFVKAGINVALVEYDLTPNVSIGTIVEQVRRGIAWLHSNSTDYGNPCEEIIVTGHSAGGHLTAMMFATDWAQYNMPARTIIGGVSISGLFDLDPISQTNINNDVRLTYGDIQAYSPARIEPTLSVPLVLTVGERESAEFHRQGELLRGAPGWGDVVTEYVDVKDCNHFNILDVFMDLNSEIWAAADFMKSKTPPQ
jgi:arylformamidase